MLETFTITLCHGGGGTTEARAAIAGPLSPRIVRLATVRKKAKVHVSLET